MKYHVKLTSVELIGEFDIKDKEELIRLFDNRKVITITKPSGDIFSYDLSKFISMEITQK